MSTLEIDVGDIRPVSVAFTADELVVTLRRRPPDCDTAHMVSAVANASAAAREHFELMAMGIHWPELDEDLGICRDAAGPPGDLICRCTTHG